MAKAEVEPVGDPFDAKVAAAEPATAAIDAVATPAPTSTNGARTASKERTSSRREKRRVRGPKLRPSYERQYRQTIRRVDLWTVLKISICFYLTGLVVLLFAGVCLWWIASAVGIVSNIENFIGDLVNSKDFVFLSWNVLRASTLVGLVLVCLMVVCTVLAAAFYNLFASGARSHRRAGRRCRLRPCVSASAWPCRGNAGPARRRPRWRAIGAVGNRYWSGAGTWAPNRNRRTAGRIHRRGARARW